MLINRLLEDTDDGSSVKNSFSTYKDQVSCEANLALLPTPRVTPNVDQDLGAKNSNQSVPITYINEGNAQLRHTKWPKNQRKYTVEQVF